MTRYLVDTNLPSELTKPIPNSRVMAALPESNKRRELRDWLDLVMRPWFAGRLLPVTEEIAERWGMLTAEERHRGRQLTMADGLIAATALEHGLTLATRNVKDFEHLGVSIL